MGALDDISKLMRQRYGHDLSRYDDAEAGELVRAIREVFHGA
jgi:hypothetical protein